MPRGVYERKPHMRTFGQLAGQHEYIRHLAARGATAAELARVFGVNKSSIKRIRNGTPWNAGRSRGQAEMAEPAVIRARRVA